MQDVIDSGLHWLKLPVGETILHDIACYKEKRSEKRSDYPPRPPILILRVSPKR